MCIATPSWATSGPIVVLDSRSVNGRLFALQIGSRVDRAGLLLAAQLDTFEGIEVYIGSQPWPIPDHHHVTLFYGELVFFTYAQATHHTVASLQDMLNDADGWIADFDTASQLSPGYNSTIWLLGHEENLPFELLPHRHGQLRADIAALFNAPTRELVLQPAHLAVPDYAWRGVAARTLLAALRSTAFIGPVSSSVICFIDARPIMLTVTWKVCPDGVLDTQSLVDVYTGWCPPGLVLSILKHDHTYIPLGGRIHVEAGEVLTILFLPPTPQTDPSSGPDPPGDDDEHDSATSDEGSEEDRRDDPGTAGSPVDSSRASAGTGGTGNTPGRPQGHLWPHHTAKWISSLLPCAVPAGGWKFTPACLDIDGHVPCFAVCEPGLRHVHSLQASLNRLSQHIIGLTQGTCCHRALAIYPGPQATPWIGLIGFLTAAWLLSRYSLSCTFLTSLCLPACLSRCPPGATGSPFPRFLFLFLCLSLLVHGVSAIPTGDDIPTEGKLSRQAELVCGATTAFCALRTIPTPCRGRAVQAQSASEPVLDVPGPTLLEEAVSSSGNCAFSDARYLLESLHPGVVGPQGQPASPPSCNGRTDSRRRVIPLHLAEHLPSFPTHDLTQVGLDLPFGLDAVQALLQTHWHLPVALPTALRLHAATRLALDTCLCADSLPQGDIDSCDIYTDGAFNGCQSAWAYVVIGYIGGDSFLVGWARGPVALDGHPHHVGADIHTALNGERTALFWALAWTLQFADRLPCTIWVDSQVASGQTSGRCGYAASAVLAQSCRALAQLAESLGGVQVTDFQHVRAHQGHAYNELADTLAGAYSVPSTDIPPGIASLTQWVQKGCVDWLWLYIAAVRNPAMWPTLHCQSFIDRDRRPSDWTRLG